MDVKIKNAALPWRSAIKLGLSGHWLLRFFTILILSVCFTAFGLISTFLTGNYTDTFIDSVLNSQYQYTTFRFRESDELYGTEDISPLGQEVIDFVEEETGTEYIHVLSYTIDIGEFRYYTGEVNSYGFSDVEPPFSWGVYAENEATYEDFGFNVLAGRYPESVYEIAVSEKQFEYFKENGGYCDRSEGFYYSGRDKNNPLYWEYDESRTEGQEVEQINNYEDLIGKTIMCRGDAENGSLEDGFYFVKIVGVIDTHYDETTSSYAFGGMFNHYTPSGKIFVSEKWMDSFCPDGDYISTYMCTQKATTTAEAKKYINVIDKTKEFIDSIIAEKQAEAKALAATSDGFGLIESVDFQNGWESGDDYVFLFAGIGVIFGIFAVVLAIYLTNATLNGKRRQIGVLRAIGAGKRDVRKIVFSGVGFNAAISFVVSVLATFLLYKLWLYKESQTSFFYLNVSFSFFNIWNVLILAAFAIVIPLLASLPALFRFSKRSVAELLTNRENTKKRK